MITTATTLGTSYDLPLHGAHNPSTAAQGTTPGSFAKRADIGGPYAFASPDTPGMPEPSAKTAWDFLPSGWSTVELAEAPTGPTGAPNGGKPCTNCCGRSSLWLLGSSSSLAAATSDGLRDMR